MHPYMRMVKTGNLRMGSFLQAEIDPSLGAEMGISLPKPFYIGPDMVFRLTGSVPTQLKIRSIKGTNLNSRRGEDGRVRAGSLKVPAVIYNSPRFYIVQFPEPSRRFPHPGSGIFSPALHKISHPHLNIFGFLEVPSRGYSLNA